MSAKIALVIPAGAGGVRDYAEVLAGALIDAGNAARVFDWCKEDASSIDELFTESDCIYLQYSGYGYARRGAPLWMLRHLEKRRSSIKSFGVFFHELYAFGPPWGSAFWLSPAQRYIAKRIARLSDFWLTNREESRQWLSGSKVPVPNKALPVISNVGELRAYNSDRKKIAVVFGSGARRRNTYLSAGDALFSWAHRHGLALHDIGPAMSDTKMDTLLARHGVVRHGRLDKNEVAKLFSEAMYGLLACSLEYVEKSGIFAAYCAHGIAPLLITPRSSACDRLIPMCEHLEASAFANRHLPDCTSVGKAAWEWYQGHSLSAHLHELSRVTSLKVSI